MLPRSGISLRSKPSAASDSEVPRVHMVLLQVIGFTASGSASLQNVAVSTLFVLLDSSIS